MSEGAVGSPLRRATFVFDGDCGMCARFARWLRLRIGDRADVVSWQALGDLADAGLSRRDVDEAAWWLLPDGRRARGYLAIVAALEPPRGLRPLIRVLRSPPMAWMGKGVYSVIARNRRLLSPGRRCRTTCPRRP